MHGYNRILHSRRIRAVGCVSTLVIVHS